jgi:hypothetical protein
MRSPEEYLEFELGEYGLIKYTQVEIGQIELRRIKDGFYILKIYFPELIVLNSPHEYWEESTEVMLTNIPVNITSVDELDGWKIKFKVSDYPIMCTMLSIHDGEHIDNNNIEIFKTDENQYIVIWTGCVEEETENPNLIDLRLRLKAEIKEEVITPLCMWNHELIKVFKPNLYHKILRLFKK